MTTEQNTTAAGKTTSTFKAAREARGLTLADVFERTRISVENLHAIESLDFAALPPPIYARTFIRQYGRFLEVDARETLAQYEKHLAGLRNPMPPQESTKFRWLTRSRVRIIAAAGAIVAAVLIIAFISWYTRPDAASPPAPLPVQETATSAVPAPPPVTASLPATTGTETGAPAKAVVPGSLVTPANPGKPLPEGRTPAHEMGNVQNASAGESPYRISIVARDEAWLRIRSERDPPFQAVLAPGERIDRQLAAPFVLDLGNAGGVDVVFQGKPMGAVGKPGEVVHLRLP